MSKYFETFKEFADKCYSEMSVEEANDEIQAKLEHECNRITIIFPHLSDQLVPIMELIPDQKCPHGLDGKCEGCPHFVAYKGSEIFAHMAYEAYCDKEEGDQVNEQQESTEPE